MKIGDIVLLRSGGPFMTIGKINNEAALCFWFDDDTRNIISNEWIPLIALQIP